MLSGRRAQTWRYQPSYRRPRHFHEEPELNLVIRGSAVLGVGEQRVAVARGDAVLLQPGQDHELIWASPDLELYVLALKPSLSEHVRASLCGAAGAPIRLQPSEVGSLEAQLTAMGEIRDPVAVESQVAQIFAALAPQFGNVHVLSRRAIEILRVERAWSEEQIACRVGANPSQLSRHFHRDWGVRLSEYRARVRLIEFVKLVDSGQALSHAALSADFGSYAQCHRVFRRHVGVAPKDYFAGARREVDSVVAPRFETLSAVD
jgi:AraC-like DNA-binding protein